MHLRDGLLELLNRLLKTVNLTAEGLDLGRVAGLGAGAWRGQKDGGGRDESDHECCAHEGSLLHMHNSCNRGIIKERPGIVKQTRTAMVLVRYETRIECSKQCRAVKRCANKHQMILRLWGQGCLPDKKLFSSEL